MFSVATKVLKTDLVSRMLAIKFKGVRGKGRLRVFRPQISNILSLIKKKVLRQVTATRCHARRAALITGMPNVGHR